MTTKPTSKPKAKAKPKAAAPAAKKQPAPPKPKKKTAPASEPAHVQEPAATAQEKDGDTTTTLTNFPGLNTRQSMFVREYVKDFNGTQAAIRVGYSERTAQEQASRLLSNVMVKAAIESLKQERAKRLEVEVDDLVKRWHAQFTANPNEITQHRRHCCRYCWGQGFAYQYTPGEFDRARIKHEDKRAEILGKGGKDIGDFAGVAGDWYDKRRDPNQDCPECFGDGVPEVFIADTRKLSEQALSIYAGVKEGRDGIEVKTLSAEKAGEYLARHLGAFKDSLKVEVAELSKEALEEKFAEKMRKAHERQAQVLAERGVREE